MERSILIRYGELFLKGKNKFYFENTLLKNIKETLKEYELNTYKISGRLIVNKYNIDNENEILSKLQKIFGIYSISPAFCIKTDENAIEKYVSEVRVTTKTFKVDVNRADKTFKHKSMDYARMLGGVVLSAKEHKDLKVNLSNPETTIYIDIRENGETFIFHRILFGSKGMPTSTSGISTLLLSGGIDSPVAGYLMAKRGVTLQAVHFHSYPYTSVQAKEKVITLAKILSQYCGEIKLHIVPFTKIQEEINKNCNSSYTIILMRRFMMKIAERIAINENSGAIITGESLAQVASQTLDSILVTNSAVEKLPVFRPLIAFDKEEIIEISKKINTYETSILPYEDCCTVFLPKNPVISPKLFKVEKEEMRLDLENLISNAIENIETILIN